MKNLFKDFKEFILRGNVVDLAIGVVIGSAFSTVVNSVVNNLLMPPIGILLGNVDFRDLFIILKQGQTVLPDEATLDMAREAGAVTWNYGQFITDVISFLIIALCIFLIVKGIQALKENVAKKEEDTLEKAEPTEKNCPFCAKAIPVNATRCPYCTSQLENANEAVDE